MSKESNKVKNAYLAGRDLVPKIVWEMISYRNLCIALGRIKFLSLDGYTMYVSNDLPNHWSFGIGNKNSVQISINMIGCWKNGNGAIIDNKWKSIYYQPVKVGDSFNVYIDNICGNPTQYNPEEIKLDFENFPEESLFQYSLYVQENAMQEVALYMGMRESKIRGQTVQVHTTSKLVLERICNALVKENGEMLAEMERTGYGGMRM